MFSLFWSSHDFNIVQVFCCKVSLKVLTHAKQTLGGKFMDMKSGKSLTIGSKDKDEALLKGKLSTLAVSSNPVKGVVT